MRVNLYAGPGSGKSTTAAYLFSELKIYGASVELVSEYVKAWAIQKRNVAPFDQIYLMGKQLQYEYRFINAGIKNIVTDSPVLLSACYTAAYYPEMHSISRNMESIIMEYERQYPAINIFLARDDKEYKTEGRYQSYDEAKAMDDLILGTLDRLNIEYATFSFFDRNKIAEHIKQRID